jgi:hypothetical protein
MDIKLFFGVVWRFRLVVLVGLLAAVALTVFSVARVSSHGLSYRQGEEWTSASTIWVTQSGFPLGRSVYDKFFTDGTPSAPAQISQFSDPSRFSSLATIYVALITSDPVIKLMASYGPVDGAVNATQPSLPGNASITLPFVQVTGTASSGEKAVALTNNATRALVKYVAEQQRANSIPQNKRVVLQVIQQAHGAVVTKPRKLTTPIVVFLACLMVTFGLAFLLENLRPRIRQVDPALDGAGAASIPTPVSRRSA